MQELWFSRWRTAHLEGAAGDAWRSAVERVDGELLELLETFRWDRDLLVLTADHAVCPIPEQARSQGLDGGHLAVAESPFVKAPHDAVAPQAGHIPVGHPAGAEAGLSNR